MKPAEFRNMTSSEIYTKLEEFKIELFNLRFQAVSHQIKNPKRIREVKKIIARILTIIKEKE